LHKNALFVKSISSLYTFSLCLSRKSHILYYLFDWIVCLSRQHFFILHCLPPLSTRESKKDKFNCCTAS
jgi:hypothetical protein